jgi:hypothetical protein
MRDLSHAPLAYARVNSRTLAGGLSSRTHVFVDGGHIFNLQSTRFLQPLHVFLPHLW